MTFTEMSNTVNETVLLKHNSGEEAKCNVLSLFCLKCLLDIHMNCQSVAYRGLERREHDGIYSSWNSSIYGLFINKYKIEERRGLKAEDKIKGYVKIIN